MSPPADDLIDCDVAAVLLRDDTTARWVVAAAEGTQRRAHLPDDELPAPLGRHHTSSVASLALVTRARRGLGS